MNCRICEERRARRNCPAVRGDICAVCCGTGREVSIDCPLDCIHLEESRQHEKLPAIDRNETPNPDVQVTESFLAAQADLLFAAGRALLVASLETPGAVDNDVREALDAIVRTLRTMETGLLYETRPSNLIAASIQQRFRQALDQYQRQRRERLGMETLRNADILGVLVFFQRMEYAQNNGRARGRAFLDFLRRRLPAGKEPAETAGRIAGGSPFLAGSGLP